MNDKSNLNLSTPDNDSTETRETDSLTPDSQLYKALSGIATETGAPLYIQQTAMQEIPQPYALEDVTMYCFVLEEADPEALQSYVDRCLNQPRAEKNTDGPPEYTPYYRVFANNILAFLSPIGKTYSLAPDLNAGWVSEVDGGFWIMVARYENSEPPYGLPKDLMLFPVGLFVDNVFGLVGGREIFGYPKSLGTHKIPKWPGDPGPFSISTLLQREYDPKKSFSHGRVWEVQSTDTNDYLTLINELLSLYEILQQGYDPVSSSWDPRKYSGEESYREVFKTLFRALFAAHTELSGVALNTTEKVHPEDGDQWLFELGNVFLKQFRDVTNPALACYQAVVEAPYAVTDILGFGFMTHDFEFFNYPAESLQFCKTLGLKEKMKVLFATWTQFNMNQRPGLSIWESSGANCG